MDHAKSYRESVRAPVSVRMGLSVFTGCFFLASLTWIMKSGAGDFPAILPALIFVAAVSSVAFLLVTLFYRVSIRLSKRLTVFSGTREFVLRVGGIKRGDRCHIRVKDIQLLEIRPYRVPAVAAVNPFFPRKGRAGEHVVLLPGYRGNGLLVTFSRETVFSSKPETHRILFPTNYPEKLKVFLSEIPDLNRRHLSPESK